MSSRSNDLVDRLLEASVVGSFTKIGSNTRRHLEHWTAPQFAAGRTMVITGGTSGLGLAAAEALVALGANVHIVGRSTAKLDAAAQLIETGRVDSSGSLTTHTCDLSLLQSTQELADSLKASCPTIDVLLHNAGALLPEFTPTAEGVETTLAVHLLSPFLLTEMLKEQLVQPRSRVITMTSGGMYTERFDLSRLEMSSKDYRGTTAYARAKRAQTVLVAAWQTALHPMGIDFHLVHPGWADTPGVDAGLPGFGKLLHPLLRSPSDGADTAVWLAGSADGEPAPGQLWLDRRPRSLHKVKRTRLTAEEEASAEATIRPWCADRIGQALGRPFSLG